ncbi:alpha/beta fold hydrolase [Streptomyces durbertensis]|uniref:Alpha/beta fold hydrolase n=1 Tax=Streptomyces durbertensis TaxID=2448886 RepID=A0ABR6EGN8_9ACTN|nr:alpha/beta fold hydrolase [Streptomyces durbertensis]MBB1244496.1 alpha/beta fold hydrolase [Streptomyces durbertensis]
MSGTEWSALVSLDRPDPVGSEAYGPHPSQVVDRYGPRGGPRVTVLHGGYWREAYDRRHLSPFAAALGAAGFSVELVEYRRVGGGGGWAETSADVDAALDHLGGPPKVLLGHSAGGQLALWAAARRDRAADRVVAVAPVADLSRAYDLGLSDGAVTEFLGGHAEVRRLLPEADPMRLLPRVPVEVLHGTADQDVPIELSRRYANNWGARLHLLPGVGHFAAFHPQKPAYGVLLDIIRRA